MCTPSDSLWFCCVQFNLILGMVQCTMFKATQRKRKKLHFWSLKNGYTGIDWCDSSILSSYFFFFSSLCQKIKNCEALTIYMMCWYMRFNIGHDEKGVWLLYIMFKQNWSILRVYVWWFTKCVKSPLPTGYPVPAWQQTANKACIMIVIVWRQGM